jgi:hypothetical protein
VGKEFTTILAEDHWPAGDLGQIVGLELNIGLFSPAMLVTAVETDEQRKCLQVFLQVICHGLNFSIIRAIIGYIGPQFDASR